MLEHRALKMSLFQDASVDGCLEEIGYPVAPQYCGPMVQFGTHDGHLDILPHDPGF